MKRSCALAAALVTTVVAQTASADEVPRRSEPLWITGITVVSAGLSMAAVSGIVAATTQCVTFPGHTSGCRPELENTYALPLVLTGGVLTVIGIPIFSIGFERDRGPLEVSSIEVAPTSLRLRF